MPDTLLVNSFTHAWSLWKNKICDHFKWIYISIWNKIDEKLYSLTIILQTRNIFYNIFYNYKSDKLLMIYNKIVLVISHYEYQ